jgi:hypothetical protein
MKSFLRVWRGWRIVLPAIVINALMQAALLLPGVQPYLRIPFILIALIGFFVLVASLVLVTAAMLQAATGAVTTGLVLDTLKERFWLVLLWSLGLVLVVTIGLSLYVLPGLVVLALTPFVVLAVVDGQRNPLGTNFRVIRAQWGSWLWTIIVIALACVVLWFFSALNGFFVTGAPAAFFGWLVLGFASSWFISRWAGLYKKVVLKIRTI